MINIHVRAGLESLLEEAPEVLPHAYSPLEDFFHFPDAFFICLTLRLLAISDLLHICLHLGPQVRLVKVDAHLRIHFH